jgi:hypothetical protein
LCETFTREYAMRYALSKVALCAGLLMFTARADAAILVFGTPLLGGEEVPPVNTTGTGTATITIDDALRTMRVQSTFANLLGTTSIAHIHCCAPFPSSVPPATTVPTFPGFPTGVQSGTYDATFDMTLASSYNPAFIAANGGTTATAFTAFVSGLSNEQAYFNIHTNLFPAGEIRGQLSPVPEPSTWGMMLFGFGLIGALMRRRRRAAALYA